MVTLESLLAGGIGLSIATYFVEREGGRDQRQQRLREQVDFYKALGEDCPQAMQVRNRADLGRLESDFAEGREIWGFCLLMEGVELLDSPEQLEGFRNGGVRLLSLTWNEANQWASGARNRGGLKAAGRELLSAMSELGIILDVSHLNRQSFFEVLEAWRGPVVATHSNADALCPSFRNLTDEQLAVLRERDVVAGVLLGNGFLQLKWKDGDPPTPLSVVVDHIAYLIDHLGEDAVGIGSDFDGGLTPATTPQGLDSAAHLPRIGEAMREHGLSEEVVSKVMGGNWLRFLREHLPE